MKLFAKTDQRQLTEGPLLRSLSRLTIPMLVSAVLQNLQSVIDLFWVGSLGPTALAAVAMGATVMMVLFPVLMGLSTGTIALVARAIGSGRDEEASAAAGQSLMLALVLGAATGVVAWHFSDHLLYLLGADPAVVHNGGSSFLRISLLGSFTVIVLFIATAALQGAGDTITPMIIMAVSTVLNIVLEPIFIFGVGPIPAMGVPGAALATVLAQAIAACVAIHMLFSGRARLRTRLAHCRPNFALAWRILRIGIPGSGQMLSRSLVGAVLMRTVATCGTAAVAAYGTGLRLHMIILMPAFALGGAAATMVGQSLGAGKPGRARQAAWLATGVDVLFMVVAALVLMVWARGLIQVFNQDPAVVAIGADYLRTVSPFYVFAALGIVLGRALNGAGDSLWPMIFTMLSLWGLQVPLAIHFAHTWPEPTHGIWWAIVIATIAHGMLIAAWFETGRWKTLKV